MLKYIVIPDECTNFQAIIFALNEVSYNHPISAHNSINLPALFCFFWKNIRISEWRFDAIFIMRSIRAVVNRQSAAQRLH